MSSESLNACCLRYSHTDDLKVVKLSGFSAARVIVGHQQWEIERNRGRWWPFIGVEYRNTCQVERRRELGNKWPLHLSTSLNMKVLVAQSCLTLCDPMDCSPPGSSVHGVLQARILEWIAIPFSNTICEGQKKQTSKGSSMPLLFGPEGEAITQGGLLITTWKIGSQSSRCCSAEYLSKARWEPFS